MARLEHLKIFYELLDELKKRIGGECCLRECSGKMDWPKRGVYFFTEQNETKTHSGHGKRIVRVGTHALTLNSKSTLWGRLKQHKGNENGEGNHRGSIFRLITGTALTDHNNTKTWGKGSTAKGEIRQAEQALEKQVSAIIGTMPFLWLEINDEPSPYSQRGIIERGAIALLSNYNYKNEPLDPPSETWLGYKCNRPKVRCSGLWNQNHVDENYDPKFLDHLEILIKKM